jgi:hypothetical protein
LIRGTNASISMMHSLAGTIGAGSIGVLGSGMANQNSNSPAAATPASVRKAALYPALTTTKPATVVDSAAPIPCAVMPAMPNGAPSFIAIA